MVARSGDCRCRNHHCPAPPTPKVLLGPRTGRGVKGGRWEWPSTWYGRVPVLISRSGGRTSTGRSGRPATWYPVRAAMLDRRSRSSAPACRWRVPAPGRRCRAAAWTRRHDLPRPEGRHQRRGAVLDHLRRHRVGGGIRLGTSHRPVQGHAWSRRTAPPSRLAGSGRAARWGGRRTSRSVSRVLCGQGPR